MPRCAVFSRFIEAEDALGSRFGERGTGNTGESSSAEFPLHFKPLSWVPVDICS